MPFDSYKLDLESNLSFESTHVFISLNVKLTPIFFVSSFTFSNQFLSGIEDIYPFISRLLSQKGWQH